MSETIYYDSPEAAIPVQVTGYKDAKGRVWLDESCARYESSNKRRCEICGADTAEKYYTFCEQCVEKKNLARFLAMPVVKWDGKTPLVAFGTDTYFFDEDSASEYISEHPDARICVCVPNHFRELDGDYFSDELPEDGELPTELEEAIDAFNAVIAKLPPASWCEGRQRIDTRAEFPLGDFCKIETQGDQP